MEITHGRIVGYDERAGELLIRAKYDNYDRMAKRQYTQVEVGLEDGRYISPDQRKKAHALIGEIAEWCGDMPEYMKHTMKATFIHQHLEGLEKHIFSLSDCDMTTAREFITFLIDFILDHEIPTKKPLVRYDDDIERYVYACLIKKRCAVTHVRKGLQLHHVDRVGMGRSRDEICHVGMLALPLRADLHREAHSIGDKAFCEKYHLAPVKIDEKIAKIYKLGKKEKSA